MTTNRIKRTVKPALTTREQFEALVGDLARDLIQQRATKIAMDDELQQVRTRFERDLVPIDAEINARLAIAQEYCDAHPELFRDRKSLELVHAVVGYRTGQPKLAPLRGWTWKRVTESMLALPFWAPWIRTKQEPDREAILAQRNDLAPKLAEIGVAVAQDETFFVEPKLETLETRLVAAQG